VKLNKKNLLQISPNINKIKETKKRNMLLITGVVINFDWGEGGNDGIFL